MESLTSLAAAPPPGVAGSLSRRNEAFQGNQVSHGKIDKTAPAEIGKCASAYHSIEQDEIEFQGYPADRTFIQGLREELGDWSVDATRSRLPAYAPIPGLFHMDDQFSDEVPLPPRAQAIKMIEAALDAQILLYIIHRPSFDVSFNLIYSLDKSEYSLREKRFLALLYAVFAYGSLFIEPDSRDINLQEFISQAYYPDLCVTILDHPLTFEQVTILCQEQEASEYCRLQRPCISSSCHFYEPLSPFHEPYFYLLHIPQRFVVNCRENGSS